MSTPTFRSLVCSRGRPELLKTGQALSNYVREFSTTQSLADDAVPSGRPGNDGTSDRGRGNARQRGRAAASAINTMVKNRGPSASGPRPDGGGGGGGGGPKVLDVRSLPRGLGRGRGGGRGGLRGGGGFQGRGDGGVNRFAPGGRGRGGGRGGAAARGRGRRPEAGGGQREARAGGKDAFETMDEAETALDRAVRFRQPERYGDPTLDVAALLAHAPAAPTSAAGRRAAVAASLQALGGGTSDLVGAATGYLLPPAGGGSTGAVEDRVRTDGLAFFATPEARAWAEDHARQARKREEEEGGGEEATTTAAAVFAPAGEAVRRVVLRAAVEGAHETPRFATDVHGVVRAQHLRAGSYGPAATAMFEKKLRSLVGAPKPVEAEAEAEVKAATEAKAEAEVEAEAATAEEAKA